MAESEPKKSSAEPKKSALQVLQEQQAAAQLVERAKEQALAEHRAKLELLEQVRANAERQAELHRGWEEQALRRNLERESAFGRAMAEQLERDRLWEETAAHRIWERELLAERNPWAHAIPNSADALHADWIRHMESTDPAAQTRVLKEWEAKLHERDAKLEQTKKDLVEAKALAGENAAKAADLETLSGRLREEIDDKQRHIDLSHLLTRVSSKAAERLLRDETFRTLFLKSPCTAYVLSIDVRRSTELMLKARDPAGFAQFLIQLAGALKSRILENNGVFEKFTGDGILAYFPEHFTGSDAGYFALAAAVECHEVFGELYKANRSRFSSVIKNTGLGIGIDHGVVHTMVVSGEFAVVGTPVVYACRMAGANAGQTLLNQEAFELIGSQYEPFCLIRETELDIKHEGPTVAYAVTLNEKRFQPGRPTWDETPVSPSESAKPSINREPQKHEGSKSKAKGAPID